MIILKRGMLIFIIELLVFSTVSENNIRAMTNNQINEPKRIAVLLYTFDNIFSDLFKDEFIDIEKKNKGKVKFTFYDAKENQKKQNETIETILKNDSADALIVNMADSSAAKDIVIKSIGYNKPIIFLNVEPENLEDIKSSHKAYFVGVDEKKASEMEGEIIANFWQNNKNLMDKNRDDKLQYILLIGSPNQKTSIERTKYSMLAIQQAGIKTEELITVNADWNKNIAETKLQPLLLRYLTSVEAIISNNDEMAIGAIRALGKYGYNREDKSRFIPVFGIGGIPEAKELIKEGKMAGTVEKSAKEISDVSYQIAMNLINNKEPLEGTNYKFDDSGVAIRIPLYKYTG